jgi:hypothetical protein
MIAQPPGTHVAQLNIARAVDDMESERMAEFVQAIEDVNALGKQSPGFVWILEGNFGEGATDIRVNDDPRLLVNLTVWETPEHLKQFVWKTAHGDYYRRRADWFERADRPTFVMWWVAHGHIPTVDEAMARLDDLRTNGPSERAFGWAELR